MCPQNLSRYVDFGVNVFGIDPSLPDQEIADQAIQALEHFLFDILEMPRRLRDLGVKEEDFSKFAEDFKKPGTIEYQSEAFVPMSAEDVIEIYKMAY